jgi:hypothetical protein
LREHDLDAVPPLAEILKESAADIVPSLTDNARLKEAFLSPNLADSAVLKRVYELGTKHYDGKYSSALFGANFDLDSAQIDEVGRLIDITKSNIDRLIRTEPLWESFQVLIDERRQKFGSFGEALTLVEDPDANRVSKTLINGKVPAILLPPRIKQIYDWELLLRDVETTLHDYIAGRRNGNPAIQFATGIKELFRFNRELTKSD